MAHRPLQIAVSLLGVALTLTLVMALTAPRERGTLALSVSGDAEATWLAGGAPQPDWGESLESAGARHSSPHDSEAPFPRWEPAVTRRTTAAPSDEAPFPALSAVLDDAPNATGVSARAASLTPGGLPPRPARRGYEELPPPPEFEDPPAGSIQGDIAVPRNDVSPDVHAPTPVAIGSHGEVSTHETAAPTAGDDSLQHLLTELAALRRDLDRFTREAPAQRPSEPLAAELAAFTGLRQLEELRQDIRRLTDRQSDLETTLRSDAERRTAELELQRQSLAQTQPAAGPAGEVASASTAADRAAASMPGVNTDTVQLIPVPGETGVWSARFIDAPPTDVIRALAPVGAWNLVVSSAVEGRVTLSLPAARPDEILSAVAASLQCAVVNEAGMRMLLPQSLAARHRIATERSVAKFIRPVYVSAADLLACIEPLLTPGLGTIALTSSADAGDAGPPAARPAALLIVDFPEVITQVEALVAETDVPPEQLEIEAVVVAVRHSSRQAESVVELLGRRGVRRCRTTTPSGGDRNGTCDCGCFSGSATDLVALLSQYADTHVEATPTLRVLNRQTASLEIGANVGYRKRSRFLRRFALAAEAIDFLPSTASLTVRPFLEGAESVRLQVHPRIVHVRMDALTQLPRQEIAEVETDLSVPLGCTAVIGGLRLHQHDCGSTSAPAQPWFRRLSGTTTASGNLCDTEEVVILLTPRRVNVTAPLSSLGPGPVPSVGVPMETPPPPPAAGLMPGEGFPQLVPSAWNRPGNAGPPSGVEPRLVEEAPVLAPPPASPGTLRAPPLAPAAEPSATAELARPSDSGLLPQDDVPPPPVVPSVLLQPLAPMTMAEPALELREVTPFWSEPGDAAAVASQRETHRPMEPPPAPDDPQLFASRQSTSSRGAITEVSYIPPAPTPAGALRATWVPPQPRR